MAMFSDRVQETSLTTGLGPMALAGAVHNYRTFGSVCADLQPVGYVILGPGDWECGDGTYHLGANTLARTTVRSSSNGNALVNFAGGVVRFVMNDVSAYYINLLATLGAAAFLNVGTAAGQLVQLDGSARIPALDGSNLTGLVASASGPQSYQGSWNANSNTPTLVSGVGVAGQYYSVATGGATTLDGINTWVRGDTVCFDGTHWRQNMTSVGIKSFFSQATTPLAPNPGDKWKNLAGVGVSGISPGKVGIWDGAAWAQIS